jgi:hypothetical protein
MTRAHKLMGTAAALLLMFSVSTAPASAQFAGGGQDMMTQMAPMLNMMKAKMGKKRFGMLMQTVGPMASKMMDSGALSGLGGFGGGGFPSSVGGVTPTGGDVSGFATGGGFPSSFGGGYGLDGFSMGDMMAMIPQLMTLAGGGGHHHHRHAHPKG